MGDVLDLIEVGKVVPIVGRRLSLADTGGETPVPFQKAIAVRLAKELGNRSSPAGLGPE